MSNMQQYGAAKTPPWARNSAGQAIPGMQQQILGQNAMAGMGQPSMMQYSQSQAVFQPNLMQQQTNMAMGMSQMQQNSVGMNPITSQLNQGQMFSQSGVVAYPTPRALNPNAFSNTQSSNQGQTNSPKQRVFTGTVTKSHNDFGFVDEDIFFQRSACVKGSNPIVGDRVLVEASFNNNMPFKWNATRIQVLPTNKSSSVGRDSGKRGFGGGNSGYNAVPPPGDNHNGNFDDSPRPRDRKPMPVRERNQRKEEVRKQAGDHPELGDRRPIDDDRRKVRRERERERKSEEKDKVRSPILRPSNKQRKRTRPVARYMVQVPKIALDIPEADVLEVRRRYNNLYIPSDFFNTQFRWIDAFPPNAPFSLNKSCFFHVMPKDIESSTPNDAVLEPGDVDYLFCAKVMLLSMPTLEEMYRKCCALATDEKSKDSEDRDFIHPTRLISFLVGLRGKNETMAIGGPWSPSLDGPNPESDPRVLIKTAIRTCKAHTGIDLSHCTQWYRFVELYYRRAESVHRGRVVPPRVETVVIYVPDVWSCLPTRLEWDTVLTSYRQPPGQPESTTPQDQAEKSNVNDNTKKEPTLYSDLDPKTMSVTDLRKELWARNINNKGLKSQLIARLTKVLKREEVKEKSGDANVEMDEEVDGEGIEVIVLDDEAMEEDEEKLKQSEKEKLLMKARNSLPENPHLIVHPSRTAKSGKFDCTVMTLSLLLDYRQDDSKEHSFEVSLFAELFNEMLMRDFGFNIYKALFVLPDKPKEEKKGKDSKDKDSKDKDYKDSDSKDKDTKDKESKDEKKSDNEKKDSDSRKSESKGKRDENISVEDENSMDKKSVSGDGKKDKKDRPKLVTKDPNLLLSFVYFDTTHCGYIFEKDVEELLYTLGLNLSRAQVRKLVAKVVTRDSFYYRHITDKPKDEEVNTKKAEVEPNFDLPELATGNKKFLPVFLSNEPQSETSEPPHKKARTEVGSDESMIVYKGGLLDIEKLLSQLKRSEQARLDTEARLIELKNENTNFQEKQTKSSQVISNLTSDLSENKKKLAEVQAQLAKSTICTKIFRNAFKDIDIRLQSVMHSNLYEECDTPKPKTESSISRWSDEEAIKKEKAADGDKMELASDDGDAKPTPEDDTAKE